MALPVKSNEAKATTAFRAAASEVYHALAKHQCEEQWAGRELIVELQTWVDRLVVEFKLDIPEVVLSLDLLSKNRYGQFRSGHNGIGLKGEITINTLYLARRAPWETLGTLLHELLHAWQQAHGTPGKRNHHNSEFREKAEELGLIVDGRGVTAYAPWSPFKELLRRYSVDVQNTESTPMTERPASKSKLKKWSCACTNVRVAVRDFRARCLKCGQEFIPSEFRERMTTNRTVSRGAIFAVERSRSLSVDSSAD